jgi:hypothetical protein
MQQHYLAFMKKWLLGLLFGVVHSAGYGQLYESTVLNGEYGFGIGAAHYFGDLNTSASLRRPKMAASILFRKQFGPYAAVRLQGTYARLGYSDRYSKNEVEKLRNLSFNSNVFELGLMGDFNFFRFIPGQREFNFTPYVTMGIGFFTYDPFAFLNDEKYFLRPLGTEGQGSSLYPDRKPYSTMAICLPIGAGIKYNLSPGANLFFELTHRFTNTDYLDDVSTTYAGADAFPPLPDGTPSEAFLLQDRSYELTATPIGIGNRQRGNSKQKDHYITATIGITFNLTSYRCPTSN